MILITHDIEAALQVADRVAVFYAGTTVEIANTKDFTTGDLRHPYTQALWRSLIIGFQLSPELMLVLRRVEQVVTLGL